MNHRVQAFDDDGKYLFSFGTHGTRMTQSMLIRGICIQPCTNNVIITNTHTSAPVQIFTEDGKYMYGITNQDFNHAQGVRCNAGGSIFVTDTLNDRIQMFDRKGKFLRDFGNTISRYGDFRLSYPWDVCVDDKNGGEVIVADNHNQRVSIFSNDGSNFITSFRVDVETRGVCVDCFGFILVSTFNTDVSNIQIYDPRTFRLLQTIGTTGTAPGEFQSPTGMCVLEQDNSIVVCDTDNHRIQIL